MKELEELIGLVLAAVILATAARRVGPSGTARCARHSRMLQFEARIEA
jgi:hypothetical protein